MFQINDKSSDGLPVAELHIITNPAQFPAFAPDKNPCDQ